ncbi:hypothetical protein, partial [Flavobacterium sp. ov086]|uniref:beta strand repeat-containing protein n=1 Tax=Flavobacterium sp. ov086 TaxID=1761785 RepID=UPI000B765B10
MKHFYSQIKNFLNIALFLGIFLQSYLASSQTTLAVGDIIFTGYDASTTPSASLSDSYSFVLLTNISAGTIISFTDRGYTGSGWVNAGTTESTVTWTSATAIPMGTEILISGLNASTYNPSTTALTANGIVAVTEGTPLNGLSLSTVGDQIIAFQGGGGSITGGGASIKGGLSYSKCDASTSAATWDVPSASCTIGPSTSVLPVGLTNGTSAFYTGTISGNVPQSAKFNGTGVPFANAAAIRTAVMNQANWTLSLTTQTMPSGTPFLGIPPAITVNPPNRTLCEGGTTTFPITATNATGYQWQVNTGSGFTNLSNGAPYSGVTTATLTITNVTASMSGYLYRCTASGVGTANSNSATLTVPNIVVSTTALTNVTCNGGNNGSATVSVSGGFIPYDYSWSPSGITSATASGLTAGNYTVTVTDNIGCTKTYPVSISEPTLAASSPSITTQPATYIACVGSTATFNVVATNTSTYQWQVDAGLGFVNITNGGTSPSYSGVTTANLSIGSVTSGMQGYLYRAVLTSSCSNTIASNGLAQLNVNSLPVATATPSSQTICSGNATNIALTSAPTGATFAWTIATTSGTVNGASAGSGTAIAQTLTGNGTINYTVTPTLNNCPGTPIIVTVTVNPLPTATATPAAPIICSGSSTNIALTSTPTGATFAWTVTMSGSVSGASAGSGTTIAQSLTGVGTANYTVTPTINGCPGLPIIVTVTVNPLPVAIATPASNTICSGTSANVALSSTPTGATFSWTAALTSGTVTGFSNSTGSSLNQVLSGNGIVTYTVTPTLNTCPGIPITIPITVLGLTSITSHPSASAICEGTNTTFSVIASNATSYQWQENSGAGYSNISNSSLYSGASTTTLTITGATASMSGYSYRAVATGTCAPAANSNGATLTIHKIIANPTQVDVSCNGDTTGSATVTPSGGTGSYTYLWSNGATGATISNLAQGNYNVTINDANLCPTIQNFTITEPSVLVATKGAFSDPSCNSGGNGFATVLASGGSGGYTYSWSPAGGNSATASGLSAGTYTVTVTDSNNCTATQTFILSNPLAINIAGTQTDILCHGDASGEASVTVTGGTPGYTYLWSPGGATTDNITGLIAGVYTVTVTDANSCSDTKTFIITEPLNSLVASPIAQTNVNCFGDTTGSATVSVTGGTGSYSYSWSPSGGTGATASGLPAGSYTVTIFDANSCMTSQGFNISGPGAALSASTSSTPVSCFSGSNGTATVTVSGGTPNYTYSWAPSGGTGVTASGLSTGDYTCTITDSNGCTLTKTINVGTPTEISATEVHTDVSCNGGTNGSATVTASGGVGGYTYSWSPTGGTAATASGLSAGTYTVTIQDANTCSHTIPVTIGEPAVLTATASGTDVLCNAGATGSATASASGGSGTYTYAWSPSGGTAATATGLTVGSYTCLITDGNGCTTTTAPVTINQPSALSAITSQISATCTTGGQATVTASGGAGSYTYFWSPSGQTTATATGLAAGNHSCLITDANGCALTENFTITTTNTLVAATSQTDVLCNGTNTGSASVVASGAPGPFTYVWAPSGGNSDTASNLTAGNYSVTITSPSGCSIVKNFTIIEPTPLATTPSQIDLLCNGATTGEASVVVTGGTGAYSYAWSPGGQTGATATGLTAGTYTVTVTDANLCQATQAFTITEPNALTATITPTQVSCNGGTNGSATVTATGGTGAYTYSWSPTGGTAATASGLTAGTYTVTVTDANSCTITQSTTITEPSVLLASITAHSDISCNGSNDGSATVTPTGGAGSYTYAWLPTGGSAATATGLSPGNYTVTVTDANSCTTTDNVTIIEPALLTSSITSQTDILCNGGTTGSATVTATGGNGAYSYVWSPSGGTAATATGLSGGTYTVTVTDANSCTSTQTVT